MLMALGQFVFSMSTLAYQDMQRQNQWRHPSHSRVGARPARQYVGPGDETISLKGVIAPELTHSTKTLDEVRAMANTGQAWSLVSGTGDVYGAYVIESVNETGSYFLPDGTPRRIDFSLQLARVDEERGGAQVGVGSLGNFTAIEPTANSWEPSGDAWESDNSKWESDDTAWDSPESDNSRWD